MCDWTAQEIDFVDRVFNSSAVLRERANLMEQHEGLTYELDAERQQAFVMRGSYLMNELSDDLSNAMVKRVHTTVTALRFGRGARRIYVGKMSEQQEISTNNRATCAYKPGDTRYKTKK